MQKNARNFILDNSFSMSAYWVCSGTVIASLTSYYALPLALSNAITGLTSTLLVLQLLGGFLYTRTRARFAFLRMFNLLWRLFLPLVFFSVLLPKNIGAPVMMVAYFLGIAIFQFACPSQTDWLVSTVEGRVKRDYYSIREMFFMLMFTAVFCTVSMLINHANLTQTHKTGFLAIGVLITVLFCISIVVLFKLPAPETVQTAPLPLRKSFAEPFRNKPFRGVLFTNMLWSFSGMFIGNFAAIYQIRILNLSFTQIMIWSTVANLVRALCTPLMSKIAGHIGWKRAVALCLAILACVALGWMNVTPENIWLLFPILSVLGTLPFSGMGVGFLEMQVDTAPSSARSLYFSVTATMNGLAAFGGSMVCSALIEAIVQLAPATSDSSLRIIFCVGLVGALLSAVLALRIRSDVQ
ncbi:MAG: MFS transporter [Ruthenibacterium sp.]